MTTSSRGLYFEDLPVGLELTSPARTITEADVVAFAGLSGDYNPLHTDAEFARTTMFGARIAHGMLCLSIATGLAWRMGFLEGTADAFRELRWTFSRPVYLGDTISLRVTVAELRPLPRLKTGSVTFDVTVFNQKREAVAKGQWTILVRSREAQASTPSQSQGQAPRST